MENSEKTIVVVGLGYVGLPLALCAAKKGYTVFGFDTNTGKVASLNERKSPFKDERMEKDLATTQMQATTDVSVVRNASKVIICVPTPVHEDYTPDLTPVKSACEAIAPYLTKGTLVVLESTVNPGVSDEIITPIIEEKTSFKVGVDIHLAHCPERINPGDTKWHVENIPRVIGASDIEGLQIAAQFYESIIEAPIKKMKSLKEAESVKIIENSFRDINIAFVNELAMSFSHLGIDVVNVIEGAATKPFAFMAHYPGCGVGGHCIPVDPYYLIEYAKSNGFDHTFLKIARSINNGMPYFTVGQMVSILKDKNISIRGENIAVLGLAYKADIEDCRESPSFKIIEELENLGAKVKSFDPFVPLKSTAKSIEDAISGAKGIIIATNHTIFRELKPSFFKEHNIIAIVDGKNCLKNVEEFAALGISYKGIGR